MKHRPIIIAIITVLFILCSNSAFAKSPAGIGPTNGKCGISLTWSLNDEGIMTISGAGTMDNYSSSSAAPWEAKKDSITKVVVWPGVTAIGDSAFSGCNNLTAVELPNSLLSIGKGAFSGCRNLFSISFPSSLTSIGEFAFYYCSSLPEISLPDSVISLGAYSFQYCFDAQTINLSNGLTTIPEWAFSYCNITELTIPEGITEINNFAFSSNYMLSAVHLPVSLNHISIGVFRVCEKLSDVYYSGTREQAEAIQIDSDNSYLSSANWHFKAEPSQDFTITLPSSLTIIESEAFSGLNAQMIVIPSSVSVIKSAAFSSCDNLAILYFEGSPDTIEDILSGQSDVIISVVSGSSAETWARANDLTVIYH